MSDKEELIVAEPATGAATSRTNKGKLALISVALIALLAVGFGVWRYWQARQSGAGRAVPAPRNVSFDQAGNSQSAPTEATITLMPGQAERAGIKVAVVGEKLAEAGSAAVSTGVVQANAYRETPVISLTGGIIRQLFLQQGEEVRRGQTLAIVFSEDLAATQARYVALRTELETSRQSYERAAKLVKLNPATRAELEQAERQLKTANAELEEHHLHHARTIKLVAIGAVSREELEQATTKLKSAEAAAEEANKRYERALKLVEINPGPRADFEQAAVKLKNTETEMASVRQKLLLLGLTPQRVDALRATGQISSEIAVTAPIAGTITMRSANQGEVIEANKELLRVTDLSSVWVIGQVYEKDLARIRVGSGASITATAFPERILRGQISYIDPRLDPNTRTAQVRVELANPGQTLKIGMYVNMAFAALGGAENTWPVVPKSAVQNVNNGQVVFVATDNPNVFVMRPVRVGVESDGFFTVPEGVAVGERVVTEGSFLLRAEWVKLHANQ